MSLESKRFSERINVAPTTPNNRNTPFYTGHGDGSALHFDYDADITSLDTTQLGIRLKPNVRGSSRDSVLMENTGGQLAANKKLGVENVFLYEMRPDAHHPPTDWKSFLSRFARYDAYNDHLINSHPDTYMLVTNQEGLTAALSTEGKIGVIKSIEGMPLVIDVPVGKAASEIARSGTQVVDLMWNYTTDVGDSHKTPRDNGLTNKGKEFLQACSDVGIPVFDVSHASPRTAKDMIKFVGPNRRVIASHTGAKTGAGADFTRNITDEVAQGIFERQGIVGVMFDVDFLGGRGLENLVNSIRHFVNLDPTGGKLVTLGPDMNGMDYGSNLDGLNSIIDMENVATALKRDGFSKDMIEDIFWKNAYDFWHSAFADLKSSA